MKDIIINENDIIEASQQGHDAFLDCIVLAIYNGIGGSLTSETMAELNSDQITLLAYRALHEEVMDGGFIQLIHNGYGAFIFNNPFAKAVREWGIDDLASLINKARKQYVKHRERIERECSDDEFMSMFEEMPSFDTLDDCFVENEERWTSMIAYYVDENIDRFVKILNQ